jgi:hypothetical protein
MHVFQVSTVYEQSYFVGIGMRLYRLKFLKHSCMTELSLSRILVIDVILCLNNSL